MDFPLPLTLILMMSEDEARQARAAAPGATTESAPGAEPGVEIPHSSGVFSVVAPADRANRTSAQASSRVA